MKYRTTLSSGFAGAAGITVGVMLSVGNVE